MHGETIKLVELVKVNHFDLNVGKRWILVSQIWMPLGLFGGDKVTHNL